MRAKEATGFPSTPERQSLRDVLLPTPAEPREDGKDLAVRKRGLLLPALFNSLPLGSLGLPVHCPDRCVIIKPL